MKIALCREVSIQQEQQQRQGVHDWPHGQSAYDLGLVMGEHLHTIIANIGDTDIIERFRVRQLRVVVFCSITCIV